jgi:DNA-binding response OmpR family regulator
MVARMLASRGFAVETASTGREGIQALRDGFRGVMLLDYRMPDMDGHETLLAMSEEGLADGVIVCMLTGLQQPTEPLERHGATVLNYIVKPFGRDALVAAVEDAAALLGDLGDGP